jgi:hypothetical protein
MNTEKAFEHGRDIAFDALDEMGKIFDGKHEKFVPQALTGLLVTVMSCVYAHAPTGEAGDELIAQARKWADEETNKGGRG